MSMTRNEAISYLSQIYVNTYSERYRDALGVALSALRPVSREQELEAENMELKERIINWRKYMAPTREQVEKVWRGEWKRTHSSDNFWTEVWVCSRCGLEDDNGDCFDFCPSCGAPMTDEAVEMVMERINEMEGTENGLD